MGIGILTRWRQAFTTDSAGNDALRTVLSGDQTVDNLDVTGDLDIQGSLTGNLLPQNKGSIGTVGVTEDVTAPLLYNEIFGSIFKNNALLRTGDTLIESSSTSMNLSNTNVQPVGDVILIRTAVVNTLTDGVVKAPHQPSTQFPTLTEYTSASPDGVNYQLQTLVAADIFFRAVTTTGETGAGKIELNITTLNPNLPLNPNLRTSHSPYSYGYRDGMDI